MYEYYILLLILIILIVVLLISQNKITGSSESNIIWKNKNIYKSDYIENAMNFIKSNTNKFNTLTKLEKTKLEKYSKTNKLSLNQLISIRNIINTQNSIKNSNLYKKDIINSFNSYNFHSQIDKNKLRDYFNKYPASPLKILEILKENQTIPDYVIKYAVDLEAQNQINYKTILSEAQKFENNLVSWLRKNYPDIKFKTQEISGE